MDVAAYFSFGISAVAYLVLLILFVFSWQKKTQGTILIAASFILILWSSVNLGGAISGYNAFPWVVFLLEVLKTASWLVFLGYILDRNGNSLLQSSLAKLAYISPATILVVGYLYNYADYFSFTSYVQSTTLVFFLILYNLFGLVLLEQFYRNNTEDNRWKIKYFILALSILFTYDLVVYTWTYITADNVLLLWVLKGIVSAAVVPFIAISAARNPSWAVDIFVSRKFILYTTSFLVAGSFLLLMGLGGYFVNEYGGSWKILLLTSLTVATMLMLATVVFSKKVRANIKVFISKHFYNYKYDYRDEWLRLMRILSVKDESLDVYERSIKALAQIVECPGGALWLKSDNGSYALTSTWNIAGELEKTISPSESIIKYFNEIGWIVDLDEFTQDQEKYGKLELPESINNLHDAWMIIPLFMQDELSGFVVLRHSRTNMIRTWEDLDLLKTVGLLVASHLSQFESNRKLIETKQFAAFNRMSAFIVHDLNNLVAQLRLVVKNAEKHKTNPVFMEDAIGTVTHAVEKMDRLLSELRKGRFESRQVQKFELSSAIESAVSKQSARLPCPVFVRSPEPVYVRIDHDRFSSVFEHLIRNAQEATDERSGRIDIRLSINNNIAIVEIEDNGTGMDENFMKERLFRPFDTTKGNAGMGVGVYESRQFLNEVGGALEVESKLGVGSVFRLKFPLNVE